MDELATVNVLMSDFERCNADFDRLEDENAKLRDAVRMAEVCMSYPECTEACQYHYVKDGYWECEYQDLKDELGIE